jgi:hypothetical protein
MSLARVASALGAYLLAIGCSGETLDVGDSASAAPEYAGPVSPGVDGGTEIVGPTPVANHQYGALAVAVDDSRVYWTTDLASAALGETGVVRSCAKADCAATVVTYATWQGAGRIAVNHDRVFWNAPGGVVACPLEGCAGTPAAITVIQPAELLADDRAVYLVSAVDATLLSCPVDGCPGDPTVLALVDDPEAKIAADEKYLYWSEAGSADSGTIKAIPKDASAPVRTIVSGLHLPRAVAVDADRVYWAEYYSPGIIRSCPIAGCVAEPTTLAIGQSYPGGLTVDQAHAYWFTTAAPYGGQGPGQIEQCPLDGCGSNPTVLAADQPSPTGLAIDPSFVFWTNTGQAVHAAPPVGLYYDGSVNRVPTVAP